MSPMNNIKRFVDKMLEAAELNDFKEIRKFHSLICDSSDLLLNRVKDLLDQGLIDHGNFMPNQVKFNPNAAVAKIAGILQNTLTNWSVQVEESYDPELDKQFIGDMDRIQ